VVPDGDFVLGAERSGGAFDPLGTRRHDIYRADDVVAVAEALPGRWLFITLTIDRSLFLSPEAAYQRCQERVRKVAGVLSRIWVASIEPQTKTGDGWIHWHLLVYVPGDVPLEECRRYVRRAWSIRECVVPELVDTETGEVLQRAKFKRESIGRVDVQEAGSRVGTATYVAKYIVKPWEAVPRWMGESTRKQRKFRLSGGFYEILERLHRHTPTRGSRKPASSGRRCRARALYDRMARSGSRTVVFQRHGNELRFHGVLAVPIGEVARVTRVEAVRVGKWGSVRFAADLAAVCELRRWARSGEGVEAVRRYREIGRLELAAAWENMQETRARSEGFS
jgi:hypothetical protein